MSKIFTSCPHDLLLYWLRDLRSRGRNVSTKRHNHDSSELGVKTAAQPLWAPHTSESTGNDSELTEMIDPDHQGEI